MKKIINILLLSILMYGVVNAQEKDSSFTFKVGAYADTYYATDNDHSSSEKENRKLLSALNVKKYQFDLNMAQVNFNGSSNIYRMNMTLHFGSLSRYAYPSGQFANIEEANAGVRLSEGLWFDVGLFLTHVGCESVTPKDNWLTTHSLMTNFEPFYQEGLRLSYDFNPKFSGQLWFLNGYGIYEDNNKNKTLGYYFNYKLNDNVNMSLAGTAGNEQPTGTSSKLRVLNNFITSYKFSKAFSAKLSADLCNEESQNSFGGCLSARYNLNNNLSLSSRIEYFDDKNAILSKFTNPTDTTIAPKTFGLQKGTGYTLGVEFRPNSNSFIRLESRYLQFDDENCKIFVNKDNLATNSRLEMIMNFGVFF